MDGIISKSEFFLWYLLVAELMPYKNLGQLNSLGFSIIHVVLNANLLKLSLPLVLHMLYEVLVIGVDWLLFCVILRFSFCIGRFLQTMLQTRRIMTLGGYFSQSIGFWDSEKSGTETKLNIFIILFSDAVLRLCKTSFCIMTLGMFFGLIVYLISLMRFGIQKNSGAIMLGYIALFPHYLLRDILANATICGSAIDWYSSVGLCVWLNIFILWYVKLVINHTAPDIATGCIYQHIHSALSHCAKTNAAISTDLKFMPSIRYSPPHSGKLERRSDILPIAAEFSPDSANNRVLSMMHIFVYLELRVNLLHTARPFTVWLSHSNIWCRFCVTNIGSCAVF